LRAWHAAIVVVVVVLIIVASSYYVGRDEGPSDGNGNGPGPNRTNESLNLTLGKYPRVDGSTSARPLGRIIACEVLAVPYDWCWDWSHTVCCIEANESIEGYEEAAQRINRWMVQHNGTHGSYVNLIEGEKDLILVARAPSDDELELAGNESVELDVRAVALDAFVFILNTANPVEGLTTTQIRNIYTGVITNWSQVGGPEREVNAYQRDRNSGSQELMMDLVMQGTPIIDAPDMVLPGMTGPINRKSGDEQGVGYSVYFYEEFMQPSPTIKLCGVDGVLPSYNTIQSRAYIYTTEVYVVVRKDMDENSSAVQLRDWMLSEEGQAVVKESGYVPIS
jgi:phosphate transport system substrate-binding protein